MTEIKKETTVGELLRDFRKDCWKYCGLAAEIFDIEGEPDYRVEIRRKEPEEYDDEDDFTEEAE